MDHLEFLTLKPDMESTPFSSAMLIVETYSTVMRDRDEWRTYIVNDADNETDAGIILDFIDRFLDIHSLAEGPVSAVHPNRPVKFFSIENEENRTLIGTYINGMVFYHESDLTKLKSWMFFVREETAQQWGYPATQNIFPDELLGE